MATSLEEIVTFAAIHFQQDGTHDKKLYISHEDMWLILQHGRVCITGPSTEVEYAGTYFVHVCTDECPVKFLNNDSLPDGIIRH